MPVRGWLARLSLRARLSGCDDWDAFAALVAEDYAERSMDRAALVAWARALWRRAGAATLAVDLGELRIEGDRAAARVTVRV